MRIPIGRGQPLTRLTVLAALIALFAATVFIVALPSRAVVGNTVTIGSETVQTDQIISVPVDAFVSPELLGAATIEVDFDPAVLDATGCTTGGGFDSGLCNAEFDNDGTPPDSARFTVASISGLTGNIHLADITFQAIGQPGDSSALDVRIIVFADEDGIAITPVADQDGQIDIPATPTASPSPSPTPSPTETPTPTPNATPTPTATATASPSLTSTPGGGTETPAPTVGPSPHSWGDIDCSGEITPVDALKLLRADAGLSVSQATDCPQIGDAVLLN